MLRNILALLIVVILASTLTACSQPDETKTTTIPTATAVATTESPTAIPTATSETEISPAGTFYQTDSAEKPEELEEYAFRFHYYTPVELKNHPTPIFDDTATFSKIAISEAQGAPNTLIIRQFSKDSTTRWNIFDGKSGRILYEAYQTSDELRFNWRLEYIALDLDTGSFSRGITPRSMVFTVINFHCIDGEFSPIIMAQKITEECKIMLGVLDNGVYVCKNDDGTFFLSQLEQNAMYITKTGENAEVFYNDNKYKFSTEDELHIGELCICMYNGPKVMLK